MSLRDNKIILLAGMHRSGTSALARVWNLLGATLPEPLVPAGVGNELGHWEPVDVVALNDRALLSAGSDVNAVAPIAPDWFSSGEARGFRGEIAAYVRAHVAASPLTLIKDPRISPLAPLWREAVKAAGATPRFILASRDPWEIAASLAVRQRAHFPDEVWPLERATAIWLRYLLSVERVSRGAPRTFADYSWLMADWRGEIARMAKQLGVILPEIDAAKAQAVEAFLQPDAQRARRERIGGDDALLEDAHALIKARRLDPRGGVEAFDALSARFDGAFDILGGYLAGLERRASDITVAREQARRAQADMELAQRRILHMDRQRDASTGAAPAPAAGPDEAAKVRHAALIAAHRALAEQAKAERLAGEEDRAALLSQLEEARAAAESERRAWGREHTKLRRAIAGAVDVDPLDASVTTASLAALLQARQGATAQLKHDLAAAKSAGAQARAELEETETAYESIRQEVVALRRRTAAAEAEAKGLADELTEEIQANAARAAALQESFEAQSRALAERRLEVEANGEEAQRRADAHLASLQGSRAWRALSAVRRMATPLRPLLRRS